MLFRFDISFHLSGEFRTKKFVLNFGVVAMQVVLHFHYCPNCIASHIYELIPDYADLSLPALELLMDVQRFYSENHPIVITS